MSAITRLISEKGGELLGYAHVLRSSGLRHPLTPARRSCSTVPNPTLNEHALTARLAASYQRQYEAGRKWHGN